MARVGFADCWKTIAHRQAELAERGHRIEFLALDLERSASARVKVYYRHDVIPFEELDTVASLASHHDSSRAAQVYRLRYGGGKKIGNFPMTCLAFSGTGRPEHANVYLRLKNSDRASSVPEIMRREGIARVPVISGAAKEFLSFRTREPHGPADIGLYMRFPQQSIS